VLPLRVVAQSEWRVWIGDSGELDGKLRQVIQPQDDHPRPAILPVQHDGDVSAGVIVDRLVESLLLRGTIPYCAVAIESLLGVSDQEPHFAEIEAAVKTVALTPSCRFSPQRFGSKDEEAFYKLVDQHLGRPGGSWNIVPQIQLSSLVLRFGPNARQRGDFALMRADSKSILVEIDGDQHREELQKDAARDAALTDSGVQVFRIPAEEVRQKNGPNLRGLWAVLDQEVSPQEVELSIETTARWTKWLHQI